MKPHDCAIATPIGAPTASEAKIASPTQVMTRPARGWPTVPMPQASMPVTSRLSPMPVASLPMISRGKAAPGSAAASR